MAIMCQIDEKIVQYVENQNYMQDFTVNLRKYKTDDNEDFRGTCT